MPANREYLARQIKQQTGMHLFQAENIIDDIISVITQSFADGYSVQIRSLGSFYLSDRKSRVVHNPKTGEEIFAPETKVMKFRASKSLTSCIESNISMILRSYSFYKKRNIIYKHFLGSVHFSSEPYKSSDKM